MAQTSYRAMTQQSILPLLSLLSGQSVMVPQVDQTYIPGVNPADSSNSVQRGNPELFYCHNVMPSTAGFQSVGYIQRGTGDDTNHFDRVEYAPSSVDGVRFYVGWDHDLAETIKILRQDNTWVEPANAPQGLTVDNQVSISTVNGITYITVAFINTYTYNYTDNALTVVTLNSIDPTKVGGMIQSNGYNILWTNTGTSWSATNDPLDFDPSLVTGAGGGDVQEARGPIVWCQTTSYGFIIYTTANIVSATYTGNTSFPFNFQDLGGGGGLSSAACVSQESTGNQYAYTTNGIQKVFHTGATTFLPNITDFLAGKIFEDFNDTTLQFEISELTQTMRKKVTLVNDRYLVISYGINEMVPLSHAIVFDIVQQRMGKLKIQHECCFELRNQNADVVEVPRDSIAFLNFRGDISTVDFNTMSITGSGVALYGKYELQRSNMTMLDAVTVENIAANQTFNIFDMSSIQGKDFDTVTPGYEFFVGPNSRIFNFSTVGKNHSMLMIGSFNNISMEILCHNHGRR